MPESSLQDLRDDWKVGDEVLVEFQGHSGATASLRAGRITNKEAAFATVRIENGSKHKVPYKRLRRVAKAARPKPVLPAEQMDLLRSVPPALARLAAPDPAPIAGAPVTATTATTSTPPAAPAEREQILVKLPPRSAKPVAPTPKIAAPAPAIVREEPEEIEELETDDPKAWLKMSAGVLKQLSLKSKELQIEYNDAATVAAEKLAEFESVQADIDTLLGMRDFIAKFRPKVPLRKVRLR